MEHFKAFRAKIGVYTFNNAKDNYGQVLQYLATQEYLNARGHDTCLIEPVYNIAPFLKRVYFKLCSTLFPKPRRPRTLYDEWAEITERMEHTHPRRFQEFKRKYLQVKNYSLADLSSGALDVVAVGSDQTWSYFSQFSFCDFQKNQARKVAFAPSMGQHVFSEEIKEKIKPLLEDFDLITCREVSGVNLCKDVNVKGHLVLDPTFLLNEGEYKRFEQSFELPKNKYLLVYMLGATVDVSIQEIHEFANSKGLDVLYVASQGREDEFAKCYATIPQWLYAIRHASYVITNSFHGMAFSVIYRKQFLTLPLNGETKGQNERITVLANQLGLEERIFHNRLDEVMSAINFDQAERYITKNKNKMDTLLSNIDL